MNHHVLLQHMSINRNNLAGCLLLALLCCGIGGALIKSHYSWTTCHIFCKGSAFLLKAYTCACTAIFQDEIACRTDHRSVAFAVYESSRAMSNSTVESNVCHKTHKSNVSLHGCFWCGYMQNALSCRPYHSFHTKRAFLCLLHTKCVDS